MKLKLPTISHASHERGQSLVELALSLTVMMLLLAGAVTFGMALFSFVAIRDAAQEGALYGSFNPYDDVNGNGKFDSTEQNVANAQKICERVRNASDRPVNMQGFSCVYPGPSNPNGNSIGVEVLDVATKALGKACENPTAPNGVKVTVGYDYPIIMPYIGGIIGRQTIHLKAEVTDTILEPKCP